MVPLGVFSQEDWEFTDGASELWMVGEGLGVQEQHSHMV